MSASQTSQISTAWAIVLLLLAPSRLVEHSVTHAIHLQPAAPDPIREQELRRSLGHQFSRAIAKVRSVLLVSFLVVAGAIGAALVTAVILNVLKVLSSANWDAALQYGGIAVLLWATLGRVGHPIETWDKETLPERVDLWIFRLLYVLGSYALALSVAW